MHIEQRHPHFVGRVTGIDLAVPLAEAEVAAVVEAIDRLAVLVFADQGHLDDEAQIACSGRFGQLQQSITLHRKSTTRRLRRPELSDISNVDENGARMAPDDERRLMQRPARLWHSDSSFRDPPGLYTFLAARTLPPEGGDTEFADMRAAYDALAPEVRRRVDPLRAAHSLARSRALADAPELSADEQANLPGAVQPFVRVHPGSGRSSLYLSSHCDTIVGMPIDEGRALIEEMMAFATRPPFVYRHRWEPGDLIMWDNRCTMHRATPFRDDRYVRDMRRTTTGDTVSARPVGEGSVRA